MLIIKNKKDILLEMSLAHSGDYNFGEFSEIFNYDFFIKFNKFKYVIFDDIVNIKNKKYNLLIETDGKHIFIFNKDNNDIILSMMIEEYNTRHLDPKLIKRYNQVLIVRSIKTADKYRNKGIAKFLYQFLIDGGSSLMGDAREYDSARYLWASMNKVENIKLDILEIDKGILIHENIKLKDIYDTRVWKIIDPNDLLNKEKQIEHMDWIYKRLIAYKV